MSQPTENSRNAGLLVLRLAIGGLMLFHGVDKLNHGIGWMPGALARKGLPELLAYGVYVGEVLAPLLLLLGWFPRFAGSMVTVTMGVAVFVAHSGDVFALGKHGQWALELQALYGLGGLAIALLGAGKWAVPNPFRR